MQTGMQARGTGMTRAHCRRAGQAWARVGSMALLLAACGGGGGGGVVEEEPPVTSPSIEYAVGAPSTGLGQQPLTISLAAPTGARPAVALAAKRATILPGGVFGFPAGPDGAGDLLPRIAGSYDRLTGRYTQGLGTKLWIDLPASAGSHAVALEVSRVLQADAGFAAGDPGSGEMLITRRTPTAEFGGRLRLAFNASAAPVCLGWDAARDGSYEVERCMSGDAVAALWQTPDVTLAIPEAVQRAAGASHAAWARFAVQFELAVTALRMATDQHDVLAAAAPGASAATVSCGLYPPSGSAGQFTMAWLDRNGSGRFDSGDDVRFVARDCWNRLDEGGSGPGRLLDGTLELRGYERDTAAAPTFVALQITETADVGGVPMPQSAQTVDGGFTMRLPGLTAAGSAVASYLFDAGNMVAAAGVAARSTSFYADIGDLAFQGLRAALTGPRAPQDLGLCGNAGAGGTSTMTFEEGPAPNTAGLSEGDAVRLTLVRCDVGRGGYARLLDGSLVFTVWKVTVGPAPDWAIETNLALDLQATTPAGHTRRLGEMGLDAGFVLGHSYLVRFRSQSLSAAQSVSGVLTALRNGVLDYQIGCFDASYYRGAWAWSDHQLLPGQVVKTAGRVFTIGMRQGEAFVFKADEYGRYLPDVALASLTPISAPECVALGVPASGVGGGDNTLVLDAWPAGDGGRVRLQLNGRDGAALTEHWVDWLSLM